jgi:hypothetical protein
LRGEAVGLCEVGLVGIKICSYCTYNRITEDLNTGESAPFWSGWGLSGFLYLCLSDTYTLWADNEKMAELGCICFENKRESFLFGKYISRSHSTKE